MTRQVIITYPVERTWEEGPAPRVSIGNTGGKLGFAVAPIATLEPGQSATAHVFPDMSLIVSIAADEAGPADPASATARG